MTGSSGHGMKPSPRVACVGMEDNLGVDDAGEGSDVRYFLAKLRSLTEHHKKGFYHQASQNKMH